MPADLSISSSIYNTNDIEYDYNSIIIKRVINVLYIYNCVFHILKKNITIFIQVEQGYTFIKTIRALPAPFSSFPCNPYHRLGKYRSTLLIAATR